MEPITREEMFQKYLNDQVCERLDKIIQLLQSQTQPVKEEPKPNATVRRTRN